MDPLIAERVSRVNRSDSECTFDLNEKLRVQSHLIERTWIAITSSRLGHDPMTHRSVCRFVTRCLLECRSRNAVILVAVGSAIEPWALRAAELFQVPVIQVNVGNDQASAHLPALSINGEVTRDEAVIAIADRVDAVYVRRNGKIANQLSIRAESRKDATTRVAITGIADCAGKALVADGVVGWLAGNEMARPDSTGRNKLSIEPADDPAGDIEWIHNDNEWLVHCTRANSGPWPGQTEAQYRDEILLSQESPHRQPIDTLRRILRSGKLIANAIVSSRKWPVVCFSEAPLAELLVSRCYRPHLKRWDYEPYGIAVRKTVAEQFGFQPVIYGDATQRDEIGESDQYRFQSKGKTFDWTSEREWRHNADVLLEDISVEDARVFVATHADADAISGLSRWPVSVLLQSDAQDADF